jgi:hypothetical protein
MISWAMAPLIGESQPQAWTIPLTLDAGYML